MAITKNFSEIFRRYLPDEESQRILNAGHDLALRMHPSKDAPERVEIEITFDFHVEDIFLHRIEEELHCLPEVIPTNLEGDKIVVKPLPKGHLR